MVLDLSSGSGKIHDLYFGSGAIGYAGGMPKPRLKPIEIHLKVKIS
ncbi:hypothetical protein PO124_31535 [Bacillus licheniformis]|nr:hypothetical protein [Bacillus licheniformis]